MNVPRALPEIAELLAELAQELLAHGVPPSDPVRLKWVTIGRFAELSGYTDKAIRHKIDRGVWLEGTHWRRAPDERLMVNAEAIEQWVEGVQPRDIAA